MGVTVPGAPAAPAAPGAAAEFCGRPVTVEATVGGMGVGPGDGLLGPRLVAGGRLALGLAVAAAAAGGARVALGIVGGTAVAGQARHADARSDRDGRQLRRRAQGAHIARGVLGGEEALAERGVLGGQSQHVHDQLGRGEADRRPAPELEEVFQPSLVLMREATKRGRAMSPTRTTPRATAPFHLSRDQSGSCPVSRLGTSPCLGWSTCR